MNNNRHDGVSCDACLKGNFKGHRYKCLICFDYDLCGACYDRGATTTRHTADHPMQCILTRAASEISFGGENVNHDMPQSFTCPFCGRLGFSVTDLTDHVTNEHGDSALDVICPICAAASTGDPNLVTDDLSSHLNVEHRSSETASATVTSGQRDLISFLEDPPGFIVPVVSNPSGSAFRHVRRSTHNNPMNRARPRRSTMHFSPSNSGLSSLSQSSRDAVAVDPIAELLSQLSGVRRAAAMTAPAPSLSGMSYEQSRIQQLHMQLQLDRQQRDEVAAVMNMAPRRVNLSNSRGDFIPRCPNVPVTLPSMDGLIGSMQQEVILRPNSSADGDHKYLLNDIIKEAQSQETTVTDDDEVSIVDFAREIFAGALSLSLDEIQVTIDHIFREMQERVTKKPVPANDCETKSDKTKETELTKMKKAPSESKDVKERNDPPRIITINEGTEVIRAVEIDEDPGEIIELDSLSPSPVSPVNLRAEDVGEPYFSVDPFVVEDAEPRYGTEVSSEDADYEGDDDESFSSETDSSQDVEIIE